MTYGAGSNRKFVRQDPGGCVRGAGDHGHQDAQGPPMTRRRPPPTAPVEPSPSRACTNAPAMGRGPGFVQSGGAETPIPGVQPACSKATTRPTPSLRPPVGSNCGSSATFLSGATRGGNCTWPWRDTSWSSPGHKACSAGSSWEGMSYRRNSSWSRTACAPADTAARHPHPQRLPTPSEPRRGTGAAERASSVWTGCTRAVPWRLVQPWRKSARACPGAGARRRRERLPNVFPCHVTQHNPLEQFRVEAGPVVMGEAAVAGSSGSWRGCVRRRCAPPVVVFSTSEPPETAMAPATHAM